MARPLAEKCRRCAKLSVTEAKEKDCWAGQVCHVRRHGYRNRDRYNKQKKKQYAIATGKIIPEITVAVPATPAAILHLYRVRVDAPLHAIAAELWIGQQQVAKVEPVHCLGWTGMQVKQYSREVLKGFSGQLEDVVLDRFETTVELNPNQCPIRPCPLHPE
ncbi:hypothetical protein C1752_08965 [Acaryochloris thomasi RCC1774]|uniref:Uncharacterized protein n=1 Tax=Acaryochloris thomasi RCC1774 TaxID=1764569 RepID=A0A2W1J928_9CYAN|nr:hypothetical protein [Acaryochloris thomasi]PZD70823.1 hypothetical protein C1752_08965 [Acaryochloris thomasi RCC1774]